MMPILLAMLIQTAPALPAITVAQGADGGYLLKVAPFAEARLGEVSDAVAAKAAETCGGPVLWGRLSYTGNIAGAPVKASHVNDYVRGFHCVDASAYRPAPDDWKPASADQSDARDAVTLFYAAIDADRMDRAFTLFAPGAAGAFDIWSADERRAKALIGTGTRRITGMQWFVNPPTAPHPGIYVRLTFAGTFSRAPVYCGSINLYRVGPANYQIVGDQQHMLPDSDHPDARRIAEYRAHYCE